MKWYIGCSGFYYKEWRGLFYPEKLPQRRWFEYYSERFNTLELNSSFYRFPQLKSLQAWYDKSPPSFLFSTKAPRLITHYKQFNDSTSLLSDFYEVVRDGLREKSGPVLFQLPPSLKFSEDKLKLILDSLDKSFDNVIEFRHSSWWNEGVRSMLKENGIAFCGISYPQLPDVAEADAGFSYYRFHGIPKLYYSAYPQAELKRVVTEIKEKNVAVSFVYFNNTATAEAIQNALDFIKYTGQPSKAADEKKK